MDSKCRQAFVTKGQSGDSRFLDLQRRIFFWLVIMYHQPDKHKSRLDITA